MMVCILLSLGCISNQTIDQSAICGLLQPESAIRLLTPVSQTTYQLGRPHQLHHFIDVTYKFLKV